MAISQRGQSFQVSVTVRGQRRRKTVKELAVAQQLEQQWLQELGLQQAAPALPPESQHTLSMKQLYLHCCARLWPNPDSKPRQLCRLLLDQFQWWHLTVPALTEAKLQQAWFSCRQQGNSIATINRKKSALSGLFKQAVALGVLDTLPISLLADEASTTAQPVAILLETEQQQLLQSCDDCGYQQLAAVISDILAHGVSVPQAIARCCPDLGYQRLLAQWQVIRRRLGRQDDPGFVPTICRATFCQRMFAQGYSAEEIRRLAGFKSLQAVLRYQPPGSGTARNKP